MEEKIINMLEQLYIEVKTTNKRLDSMENDIKVLKQGQTRVEERLDSMESDIKTLTQGQERIETKLDDMDAQNANRHVEINGKIDSLSKDITFVEALAGKNTADIANLKLVK